MISRSSLMHTIRHGGYGRATAARADEYLDGFLPLSLPFCRLLSCSGSDSCLSSCSILPLGLPALLGLIIDRTCCPVSLHQLSNQLCIMSSHRDTSYSNTCARERTGHACTDEINYMLRDCAPALCSLYPLRQ